MRPMRTVLAQDVPRARNTKARVRHPSVHSFFFMQSSFRLQSPWVRRPRTGCWWDMTPEIPETTVMKMRWKEAGAQG